MNYCYQCLSTAEAMYECVKCGGRYCGGHVTPGKHNGCASDSPTNSPISTIIELLLKHGVYEQQAA